MDSISHGTSGRLTEKSDADIIEKEDIILLTGGIAMKIKVFTAALLILVLLSLTACGSKPDPEAHMVDGPGSIQTTPEPSATPEQITDDPKTTEAPLPPAVDHCDLALDYTENAEEIGTLTAFDADGKELWEYVTEAVPCTELIQIQSIGAGKDGWLMACGGEVRCISDGAVVWCNDDFGGAGAAWAQADDGTLYISGYYGPDLMVIDSGGKTLGRWEKFDSETYWPAYVDLTEDGMVDITFYSDNSVLRVDPATGVYSSAGWDYSLEYENPVYVSTTEELVDAITAGAVVILEPGVYNLTEYLREYDLPECGDEGYWNPTGVLVNYKHDGPEMVISGINDLVLRSADRYDPAELVCEPRYAEVLKFINCDNLELIDLVVGHTPEQGNCEGDVLEFEDCRFPCLSGVDLYGCGAYAVTADDCYRMYVFNSCIHDCSYGIAILEETDVEFDNVQFYDCREYTMFELEESQAEFYDCSFAGLDGNLISVRDSSTAGFYYCEFDDAALESLQQNPAYGGAVTVG